MLLKKSPQNKNKILGCPRKTRISIKTASEFGWHKYVLEGKIIGLHSCGKSAMPCDLADELGFAAAALSKKDAA
jgi:transketolase